MITPVSPEGIIHEPFPTGIGLVKLSIFSMKIYTIITSIFSPFVSWMICAHIPWKTVPMRHSSSKKCNKMYKIPKIQIWRRWRGFLLDCAPIHQGTDWLSHITWARLSQPVSPEDGGTKQQRVTLWTQDSVCCLFVRHIHVQLTFPLVPAEKYRIVWSQNCNIFKTLLRLKGISRGLNG